MTLIFRASGWLDCRGSQKVSQSPTLLTESVLVGAGLVAGAANGAGALGRGELVFG